MAHSSKEGHPTKPPDKVVCVWCGVVWCGVVCVCGAVWCVEQQHLRNIAFFGSYILLIFTHLNPHHLRGNKYSTFLVKRWLIDVNSRHVTSHGVGL